MKITSLGEVQHPSSSVAVSRDDGSCKPISVALSHRMIANQILRYIDTIVMAWPVRLEWEQYQGFLYQRKKELKNGYCFMKYIGSVKTKQGAKIFIAYMPRTWSGESFINLGFSVPKLLTGKNYQTDMHGDVISHLENKLAPVFARLQIEPLDLLSGHLRRLDIGKNFNVGTDVSEYLEFVKSRSYVLRHRRPHQNNERGRQKSGGEDNGVEFVTRGKYPSKRTICYDKFEECGEPESKGIFRLEASFRKTKAIASLIPKQADSASSRVTKQSLKHVTLLDLPHDLPQKVIMDEIHMLGLDRIITTKENYRDAFRENFSKRILLAMIEFARCEFENPGLPANKLAEKIGCSKSTANNYRKRLREAGLAYNGDQIRDLPPLHFWATGRGESVGERKTWS